MISIRFKNYIFQYNLPKNRPAWIILTKTTNLILQLAVIAQLQVIPEIKMVP